MEVRETAGRKITRLVAQRKNPDRVSVFLDGEFAFGVYQDLVLAHGLRVGAALTENAQAALLREDAMIVARAIAVRFLAAKPRTEQEIRKKLARAEFDEETIDSAIARLYELSYIDDEAYARAFAREGSGQKATGRRASAWICAGVGSAPTR